MRPLSIVLALSGILACSVDPPVDRLADAYVDLLRFRDLSTKSDTATIRMGIDSVLAAHHYSGESYHESFASLAGDPERLSAFFARVEQRLAATNPALQDHP